MLSQINVICIFFSAEDRGGHRAPRLRVRLIWYYLVLRVFCYLDLLKVNTRVRFPNRTLYINFRLLKHEHRSSVPPNAIRGMP